MGKDYSMQVKTEVDPDSLLITQTISILGETSTYFYNVVQAQREESARSVLIALGWVPPRDSLETPSQWQDACDYLLSTVKFDEEAVREAAQIMRNEIFLLESKLASATLKEGDGK